MKHAAGAASPNKSEPLSDPYATVPMAYPVQQYEAEDALTSGYGYVPPAHSPGGVQDGDGAQPGWLIQALRLVMFNVLNAALGIAGFIAVTTGISMGVGLLPLCCFGLVVLRMTLYFVGFLAELDVSLHNFISRRGQYVSVGSPRYTWSEVSSLRLARHLSSFSSSGLMASVYFLTVKFAIAIMSIVATAFAVALPLSQVLGDEGDDSFDGISGTLLLVFISALLFGMGAAFMQFTADVSCAATLYFCCEDTPRHYSFVHGSRMEGNGYPPAQATYGTTVSVSMASALPTSVTMKTAAPAPSAPPADNSGAVYI